jgi:aspartate racemase
MEEKVIGILGGMGPEAAVDCFAKIVRNTPARKDQDHLRVIIDSNPKVPDRTAAIQGRGESPLPLLVAGTQALERAGADFVIIPCVSAHFFLDDLRRRVRLPILSIFDAVAETIEREHPNVKNVGLLGTTGTVEGGLFQQRLDKGGIATILPGGDVQEKIMAAIYDIKDALPARSRTEILADLIAAAESLIARGAQGIVAACTEIPLALGQEHLPVPYFDSLLLLARAAIRRAGREPVPLH